MDEDRNGRKDPIKDGRKNGTGKEGGVVQAKSADNKIPPKRDEKINTRSALKPGKDEADALTRIYNRSAFFARAGELIAQKEAGYYLLSCVDIDSFKVINDQYGMAAGDAVHPENRCGHGRYLRPDLGGPVCGAVSLCGLRGRRIAAFPRAGFFARLYPSTHPVAGGAIPGGGSVGAGGRDV